MTQMNEDEIEAQAVRDIKSLTPDQLRRVLKRFHELEIPTTKPTHHEVVGGFLPRLSSAAFQTRSLKRGDKRSKRSFVALKRSFYYVVWMLAWNVGIACAKVRKWAFDKDKHATGQQKRELPWP